MCEPESSALPMKDSKIPTQGVTFGILLCLSGKIKKHVSHCIPEIFKNIGSPVL